jgi:hypothetical protein
MVNQRKKFIWKVIAFSAFLLPIIITIFLIGTFFHQEKEVVAQSTKMTCETKIPIGEAIDRSSDLLNDIYYEIEKIYRTIPGQIDAAATMIAGAQECDLDHCKPVCSDTSCYGPKDTAPLCPGDFLCDPPSFCPCDTCSCIGTSCSESCYCQCTPYNCCHCDPYCIAQCEPQTCKGKICPDLDIPNKLVLDAFNDINKAYEAVIAIYGKEAEETEEIGNDIILPEETEDDRITQEEAIRRKLSRARIEFNQCTIPLTQMEEVVQGNLTYTEPIICQKIFEQASFPQERADFCRDVCEEYNEEGKAISRECIECLCGSYLNYFCCH